MLNVKQRQLNLRTYYYYYKGAVDGIEGSGTKTAYRNFQRDNGLTADGIYGSNTNNKLILCIKNLQSILNKYGYGLAVDGIVGQATINAIRDFQSKNGLAVDGIAGRDTIAKLEQGGSGSITWEDIPHFQKSEMTCKCGCGLNNTDLRLMQILEQIRSHFGNKPVIITSGCRCPQHNAAVGGVQGSWHTKGKAADFYIQGVSTRDLLNYCQSLVNQGILRYTYTNSQGMNGVVHIDIGNK